MRSPLIEIDEARSSVLEQAQALEHEPVELAHALDRVLAEEVMSEGPVFGSAKTSVTAV